MLTEADIARIAERERQQEVERNPANRYEQNANNDHTTSQETVPADENVRNGHQGHSVLGNNKADLDVPGVRASNPVHETSSGISTLEGGVQEDNRPRGASKLLGVPIAVGPNVTKFLYVDMPEESETEANIRRKFDAETAASEFCTELYSEGGAEGGDEARACLASLAVALASRWDTNIMYFSS